VKKNFLKVNIIYISLFFILFFYLSENIDASPPAPAPRCHIEGIIQEVTYKESWTDTNTSGPTDRLTSQPERYELKITINEASYVDGSKSYQSCTSLYPLELYEIWLSLRIKLL